MTNKEDWNSGLWQHVQEVVAKFDAKIDEEYVKLPHLILPEMIDECRANIKQLIRSRNNYIYERLFLNES